MTHIPSGSARFHKDGWTYQARSLFLATLAATGSVREAARAVGKRPSSAYRLRDHANGAAFRADWARVIEGVAERVRESALDRAFTGHSVPMFHRGNYVGDKTVFNDGLLIALMRLYDAPAYHAGLAREAEAAKLLPPPPRHRAELLIRFEGAMEKVMASPAANDAEPATLDLEDGVKASTIAAGTGRGVAKERASI